MKRKYLVRPLTINLLLMPGYGLLLSAITCGCYLVMIEPNNAILFPDITHSLKPSPDSQIPQTATAHDSAYDFFSQEPSALNLVMLAMADYRVPRSYRHMDSWGVHTYRLVTNEGVTKLVT
jgi:hypothetical protein